MAFLLLNCFRQGCNELIKRMQQLIYKIWLQESMPNGWNISFLCAVLQKGDPTICFNYRGISPSPYSV